jgi:hypothetical protein
MHCEWTCLREPGPDGFSPDFTHGLWESRVRRGSLLSPVFTVAATAPHRQFATWRPVVPRDATAARPDWHCKCRSFGVPGKSEIRERTERVREQEDRQDLLDSIHQIRDALVYLAAREKAREAREIAPQSPVPSDPPQPAN